MKLLCFPNSIFNSKNINILLLINYIYLISFVHCRVIIPFKYIPASSDYIPTPKEIIANYLKERINLIIEIGSPKQEMQIPLYFEDNDFYIVAKDYLRSSKILNKVFDNTHSNTFTIKSNEMLYMYNKDYSTYQDGCDVFYLPKNIKKDKKEYNSDTKLNFRYAYLTSDDDPGKFGLQIYSTDEDDQVVPCPLRSLVENKINNNYLWSIHFTNKGNNLGDEGYLLLGEYPHDMENSLSYYDIDAFDKNNFKTIYDYSNQKTMNHEIAMSQIYFYNVEEKKDTTDQKFFNALQNNDLLHDIYIPQVSLSYITKLDFNLGGIVIPEYFNVYIKKIFENYVNEGKCFTESAFVGWSSTLFYCRKDKTVIKNIKNKIPTIIFHQEHLRYNFTISINDLIYEKDDYVFFLLLSSSLQKNKWVLGKPFLKKYPFIFNPDSKEIGFYSSFLLSGIRIKTVAVIAIIFSVVFIVVGILLARKKYKQHKIEKQKALEMSNNPYYSSYKSIELNSDSDGNKLYSE